MRVIGVSGLRFESPFLAGLELERAHLASHAVAAARDAQALQADRQARTAVDLTMRDKEGGKSFPHEAIVQSTAAGRASAPGVVRTARYAQDLAKIFNGVLLRHKPNQGIPVGGRSDSMPIAFFRIS